VEPVTIVLLGQPVPWARAGSKGGHRFTPAKQRNNAATLRIMAQEAMRLPACMIDPLGQREKPMFIEPVRVEILAEMQIPASWSKKKQTLAMVGKVMPSGKPDLSNIVKQVEDALNGVVFRDDALVVMLHASKRFGMQPKLVITVSPLLDRTPGCALTAQAEGAPVGSHDPIVWP
jgi:Holliday junction resolvase RusA-like endonuclease